MFTRSNLKELLKLLDKEQLERITAGVDCFEYVHLECSFFNAGAIVRSVSLSNYLPDNYSELVSSGNDIFLDPQEILDIIERD